MTERYRDPIAPFGKSQVRMTCLAWLALLIACGSGRIGTSCHSRQIVANERNRVSASSRAKQAITCSSFTAIPDCCGRKRGEGPANDFDWNVAEPRLIARSHFKSSRDVILNTARVRQKLE